MNSPFANLFLAVQQRILDQVPEIRFIDQDLGQLEDHNGDSRPPVSWPCVLIEIDNFQFSDYSTNVQQGQGNVIVRIGFPPYSSASSLTPQQFREKAIGFYDLEYSVQAALQGWAPDIDHVGRLDRVSVATEKREDMIRVRQLVYSVSLEDYTNKWQQQGAPAALNVTT